MAVIVCVDTCTDVWWLARLAGNNEIKSQTQKENETCAFRPYIHNDYVENNWVCTQSISLRRLKNTYDEIKERMKRLRLTTLK